MKKTKTIEALEEEREEVLSICGQCKRMISSIDEKGVDEWGDWWIIESMWRELCTINKEIKGEIICHTVMTKEGNRSGRIKEGVRLKDTGN